MGVVCSVVVPRASRCELRTMLVIAACYPVFTFLLLPVSVAGLVCARSRCELIIMRVLSFAHSFCVGFDYPFGFL